MNSKEKYPIEIIPRVSYKRKIDLSSLSQAMQIVLVRRTEIPPDRAFDEFSTLREDALIKDYGDISHMSFNLLGGHFNLSHLKYIFKYKAGDNWEGGKVYITDYIDCIEINEAVYPIFFFANQISGCSIPYTRKNDKDLKHLFDSLNIPRSNDPTLDFVASTSVDHLPVNLNYWHSEFNIIDGITNDYWKRGKIGGWRQNILETVLNDILLVSAQKEVNIYDITKLSANHFKM